MTSENQPETPESTPGDQPQSDAPQDEASQAEQLPPPTLDILIRNLFFQAAVALGQLPSPITNKVEKNPVQARYTIDMINMLHEKTQGNRTDEETQIIEQVLYELRMQFVNLEGGEEAASG